jgi:hypothetical protein
MCTSVSRTERKLPPRSRVNSSALSAETACKDLLFALDPARSGKWAGDFETDAFVGASDTSDFLR